MKNSYLKLQSKYLLAGNGFGAVLLLLISIIISIFCTIICAGAQYLFETNIVNDFTASKWELLPSVLRVLLSFLVLTIAFLLLAPMKTGRDAWFLSSASGKKPRVKRVLYWYSPKNAFKSVRFWVSNSSLKMMWAIMFFSPGIIILLMSFEMLKDGFVELNLLIALLSGGVVLTLFGYIFYLIISQRYFLSSFILAKNPRVGVVDAIKRSTTLTQGRCLKIFMFKLSFMPWFLLCSVLFPVAYVWPYYKQCCLRYSLFLTGYDCEKDFKSTQKSRAEEN
ncbi:MAG TPA: DUF975 family protein [Clostridia bacterium]|nr:DUF975 family protein [Clostridia bacterium]